MSGVKPCCGLGWTADATVSLLPPGPGWSCWGREERPLHHTTASWLADTVLCSTESAHSRGVDKVCAHTRGNQGVCPHTGEPMCVLACSNPPLHLTCLHNTLPPSHLYGTAGPSLSTPTLASLLSLLPPSRTSLPLPPSPTGLLAPPSPTGLLAVPPPLPHILACPSLPHLLACCPSSSAVCSLSRNSFALLSLSLSCSTSRAYST